MGFLDIARMIQTKSDEKSQFFSDKIEHDAQTLFTDEKVNEYAGYIADGMKDALLQKIASRQFEFIYGMFNRKKNCHYEEEYRAKIECHQHNFSPNLVPSSKMYCWYANARPPFPNDGFISIYNGSDGETMNVDIINCWSLDHVIKPYRRAVEILRGDGINAKLTISDFGVENWRGLVFHAELPCDDNGNV